MTAEISARPLTADPFDAGRYVRRAADDRVDRAMDHRLNILISAPRGMGATSLLHRIEGRYVDRSTHLNAATTTSAESLLQGIADLSARGLQERVVGSLVHGSHSVAAISHRLEARGATAADPWWVLLDGPVPADVAQHLFGQMRDILFALPMRWVIIAPAERIGAYLAPPADVFFEQVVHLDGFPGDRLKPLLAARGVSLPASRQQEVLGLSDGSPRQLLTLARQAIVNPERSLGDGGYREWLERQASLSRSGAMLFDEMQGRGPVTTTDQELLRRLGFSESRMRRALQELVNEGLVRTSNGPADGPGRPPTVYHVAPGPPSPYPEVQLR